MQCLLQRAEKAEKRVKTLDQKLKDLRASSADPLLEHSSFAAGGGVAGGGAEAMEALQKKVQTLEQAREADRKVARGKLKERDAVSKELRETLEKKEAELQAKCMDVRDKAVQVCGCGCGCVCVCVCVCVGVIYFIIFYFII